jgi:hypothetical protein
MPFNCKGKLVLTDYNKTCSGGAITMTSLQMNRLILKVLHIMQNKILFSWFLLQQDVTTLNIVVCFLMLLNILCDFLEID